MSASIKTEEDIKKLRVSAHRLAEVVRAVAKEVRPGVTTGYLDDLAYKLITEKGDEPAFLNYQPFGAEYPYPASICISVNDEVVHGIPSDDRVLEEGDIVSLDGGVKHEGMISDHAVTVICGEGSEEDKQLLEVTKKAMLAGIKMAKAGNYVQDISRAIEAAIPKKYGIVKELSGHGVGYAVHEEPYVPNFDMGEKGIKLKAGMVLAIEPMVNLGTDEVDLLEDGYTFVTSDGKRSAHFEHTVLVTENGGEILSC
jgi:methionyl aminopeptidase